VPEEERRGDSLGAEADEVCRDHHGAPRQPIRPHPADDDERRSADREGGKHSWEQLQELPSSEITIDIHCVTRWSRFDTSFRGVHWRDLAELVNPMPSARFVVAHAEQGFTSNVPLEALEDEQAMIAYEADGEPLEPEHGWPLRLVVPSRYFWKSAKWLRGLELLDHDQPGFWERYGYHNDANYWREERYSF
jgi:DMSO/TMAO reductase YedYZ molybdopterin-dependent catalytic subunit